MMEFPVFKTKVSGVDQKFDLTNPEDRKKYFEAKVGEDVNKLRNYLKDNTFIAYLLGKKNSGKGTYTKMLGEIVGPEYIEHLSIGDMVRGIDEELKDEEKKKALYEFLKTNYRGWIPLDDAWQALINRSTKVLLPTELILALVKREISRKNKKTVFIDGFPRELDQISYSLFFRDLIGYREDQDIFVLINVPETVIDERIKWRRVCPKCQTSRNLKLLPTPNPGFDEEKQEFYLLCDNPECQNVRMLQKEGDELGIAPIRERLTIDGQLIEKSFNLHGIPKVLLRNAVPVSDAKNLMDDYELTPEFVLNRGEDGKVTVSERPWTVDDDGVPSYSLMPPAVVLSMIKQLVSVLEL
ncbi:MAG: nucleoside monophosphate kinase [bacterium]